MIKRIAPLMILGFQLSGCMNMPVDLDQSTSKLSNERRYQVAIHPLSEPIAINALHAWEISVATPEGAPVRQAHIDVDGGMPQHGHGLPTRPRVTQDFGDGRYLIEGMKFSMTGWWEIRLKVQTEDRGMDSVTFNKVVALPGAGKS